MAENKKPMVKLTKKVYGEAVDKAFKTVSTRMTNDRQRTASRGEAIVRREAKKRSNKNLG